MKKVLTGFAFSAFLFLNQCSNVSEPLSSSIAQDNKSVKIAIKTSPNFKSMAGRATVNVSAPNMKDLTKELQISDSMLSGTISVPIGSDRLFKVFVYDTNASIIYYGSALSDISQGLNSVNITLTDNVNGLVEITGTIKDTDTFDFPHDTIKPHDTIIPEQYQIQSRTMSFKLSPSDTQVIDFS